MVVTTLVTSVTARQVVRTTHLPHITERLLFAAPRAELLLCAMSCAKPAVCCGC